jgi:hypothetical protein
VNVAIRRVAVRLVGPDPKSHPMRSVLFTLFLLYVITFCIVMLTGPQVPVSFWSRVLDKALVIPLVAAIIFSPAFLLALVVWRFLKRPITPLGASALFVAGAITSCTFSAHPVPAVGGLFVGDVGPWMIIPMVSTGSLVVLVFGWLSHRGCLARRDGRE